MKFNFLMKILIFLINIEKFISQMFMIIYYDNIYKSMSNRFENHYDIIKLNDYMMNIRDMNKL